MQLCEAFEGLAAEFESMMNSGVIVARVHNDDGTHNARALPRKHPNLPRFNNAAMRLSRALAVARHFAPDAIELLHLTQPLPTADTVPALLEAFCEMPDEPRPCLKLRNICHFLMLRFHEPRFRDLQLPSGNPGSKLVVVDTFGFDSFATDSDALTPPSAASNAAGKLIITMTPAGVITRQGHSGQGKLTPDSNPFKAVRAALDLPGYEISNATLRHALRVRADYHLGNTFTGADRQLAEVDAVFVREKGTAKIVEKKGS